MELLYQAGKVRAADFHQISPFYFHFVGPARRKRIHADSPSTCTFKQESVLPVSLWRWHVYLCCFLYFKWPVCLCFSVVASLIKVLCALNKVRDVESWLCRRQDRTSRVAGVSPLRSRMSFSFSIFKTTTTRIDALICVSHKRSLETRATRGEIPKPHLCVCVCVFFFSQHHSVKESLKANDTCVPQTKCYCVNYNCW